MTSRDEIERLLQQTGRTMEGLPEFYDDKKVSHRVKMITGSYAFSGGGVGLLAKRSLHQSDVIELLVGALRDSEPKREYGECHHCHNGTYSCPITQMNRTFIRYANFCDECGRDLRAVVAGYWRKKT